MTKPLFVEDPCQHRNILCCNAIVGEIKGDSSERVCNANCVPGETPISHCPLSEEGLAGAINARQEVATRG